MTQSGWYADPHDEEAERFYDGATWTQHTRPRSMIGGSPPPPPPPSHRTRYIILGGVLTFALIAGLVLGASLARRPKAVATHSSDVAGKPTASPTPAMTCQKSGAAPHNGNDGQRVNAAGLSYPNPPAGWAPDDLHYPWLAQEKTYQKAAANQQWKAFIALGVIYVQDGATPQFAAEQVISCYSAGVANARPANLVIVDGVKMLAGKSGWRRDVNIPISPSRDGVTAVTADVTVVDLGFPHSYSVFFAVTPQGQQQALKEVLDLRNALAIEG